MSAVTFHSGSTDVNKVSGVVVKELFSLYDMQISESSLGVTHGGLDLTNGK